MHGTQLFDLSTNKKVQLSPLFLISPCLIKYIATLIQSSDPTVTLLVSHNNETVNILTLYSQNVDYSALGAGRGRHYVDMREATAPTPTTLYPTGQLEVIP